MLYHSAPARFQVLASGCKDACQSVRPKGRVSGREIVNKEDSKRVQTLAVNHSDCGFGQACMGAMGATAAMMVTDSSPH